MCDCKVKSSNPDPFESASCVRVIDMYMEEERITSSMQVLPLTVPPCPGFLFSSSISACPSRPSYLVHFLSRAGLNLVSHVALICAARMTGRNTCPWRARRGDGAIYTYRRLGRRVYQACRRTGLGARAEERWKLWRFSHELLIFRTPLVFVFMFCSGGVTVAWHRKGASVRANFEQRADDRRTPFVMLQRGPRAGHSLFVVQVW